MMKDLKCPLTGVYIPRFLVCVVAGFAFLFAFDYVLHAKLLMNTYLETPQLWRTVEDMQTHYVWNLVSQIALVVLTCLIYTRHHEGKGVMEGLRFGLMIGALLGVEMASSYVWMPISGNLAMAWLAGGVLTGLGLGIIYALLYKPCGNCSKDA